jgi:hypothetical protein
MTRHSSPRRVRTARAALSLAKETRMTNQERIEQLVKTIDRAIAQAEELGMAHAVYVLRVARLEADLTEIAGERKRQTA